MRAFCVGLIFLAVRGFAAFHLTWGLPAVSLDGNPPAGDSDFNPQIALDPAGNGAAVWSRTRERGATEDVWAAIYNHAARVWTGAVRISGGSNAASPAVAVDPQGNAVFVWEEGFPSQVMSRTLNVDGVWTPPLALPAQPVRATPNAQESPRVSIDGAGNAVALWVEIAGGSFQIRSAKKGFGSAWVDLGLVSSGTRNASLPQFGAVLLNLSGQGIAVWEESSGVTEVWGARYREGSWSSPMLISTAGVDAASPCAGIDANGNSVIVWNAARATIQSKADVGGALQPEPLVVSNPAWAARRPCVRVDEQGNAVVVFERYDVGPSEIPQHQFITGAILPFNGKSWGSRVDISGPSLAPSFASRAGYPVLTLNAIGDGVVIWKEYNGKNYTVQGAGYSVGTWSLFQTISPPYVNVGTSVPGYDLAASINLAGNLIAIWAEDSGGSGACQIKASPGIGLAVSTPSPPTATSPSEPIPKEIIASTPTIPQIPCPTSGVVYGVQVIHRFPGHADYINILRWAPSNGASRYKVYRGDLFSCVGITDKPYFEDHQRVPHCKEVYFVTAVDSNGHESSPMTIIVNPQEKARRAR